MRPIFCRPNSGCGCVWGMCSVGRQYYYPTYYIRVIGYFLMSNAYFAVATDSHFDPVFKAHSADPDKQSDQGLHCLPFCLHHLDLLLYGRVNFLGVQIFRKFTVLCYWGCWAWYQLAVIYLHTAWFTVNFLNTCIRTPKKFVVITLKFELCGSTIE